MTPRPDDALRRSPRRERRVTERRLTPHGHGATDAIKMTCPFCGCSESAVVRSRGGIVTDGVRRRRECVECGKRFSTLEQVDRMSVVEELEQRRRPPATTKPALEPPRT